MQSMAEPRSGLRRLLELLGLAALAVTQPVLDTFGTGAEEFVFRGISAAGIVAFGLLIVVGPALVFWGVTQFVGKVLGEPARDALHLAIVVVGVAAVVAQILKGGTSLGVVPIVVIAVLGGLAAGFARFRAEIASLALAAVSLLGVLALGLFLFGSPVADVLFDDGTATAATVDPSSPASVVLVVLDELPTLSLLDPDGEVDAERWPNFARLADTSTWFRNSSSVAPSTPTAVPALLSGRYPTDAAAVPVVDEHPQNLFTMLAGSHDLRVHESVTRICPEALCGEASSSGTMSSFGSLFVDAADVVWQRTNPVRPVEGAVDFRVPQSDPRADANLDKWLLTVTPTDRTQLATIHTILPHQPWWRLPSGQQYGRTDRGAPVVANGLDPTTYSWTGEFVRQSARSRHLLQLQFADQQLGKVLDHLEANDMFDESLVIVTADHGVSFDVGEPIRGLSLDNAAEVMWIPMFVKTPNQTTPALDERPVETIDIVPTIADVLDFELPWEVDGVSMFGPERPTTDRRFAEWRLNSLQPTSGIMVEIDGAPEYERLLDAASGLPATIPGDEWSLYRFGRYGDLLGRPLNALRVENAPLGAAQLAEPDRYLEVDPTGTEVPAYVHGTTDQPPGTNVAIVIADTVVGWSEVVETKSGPSWWTVVPSSAFMRGPNTIELFTIVDTIESDDPALQRIVVQGN